MDNLVTMSYSHLLNILLATMVIFLVGFIMLLAQITSGRGGSQPTVIANSQGETDGGGGWLVLVAVIIIAVILLRACGNMP